MFSYGYENLSRIVKTEKGKQIVDNFKAEYEKKYQGKPITALKYSDFKLIYINGDRLKYQENYFERVNRLFLLQVLAISDDKYLYDLEDVLSAMCDEYTWVLPAHNLNKDNTFDYTVIDLFSSERALWLSETVYIFGDKLSLDIRNRIKDNLKRKIVDNFESRRFLWDDCKHNWSAVCACGVALTYLYAFPERFPAVKDRLFTAFSHYIDGVEDDGVVTEGIGYWQYGFGMFSVFFDVYVQLTGDYPDLLKNPKVKKILEFATNANLGGGLFLPFADGGFKWHYSEACIHYAIKNLFPNDYKLPFVENRLNYTKALGTRYLNGVDKFVNGDGKAEINGTVYYETSQFYINKNKNYVFVAKCGNNCEMHNHNDVGCFELIKDGKKIISDLGAGKYTWKYHNDQTENGRYGKEIFVCGSWGHSIPILNGRPQINYLRPDGQPYGGKVLLATDNTFKMDIVKAYEDNLADQMIVEYILNENSLSINYTCTGLKNDVTFRFITEIDPKVEGKKVILGDAVLSCGEKVTPKIEKIFYAMHGEVTNVGECYTVDFAFVKSGEVKANFEIKL